MKYVEDRYRVEFLDGSSEGPGLYKTKNGVEECSIRTVPRLEKAALDVYLMCTDRTEPHIKR